MIATVINGIGLREALDKELGIMDTTAFAMCLKSGIPVFVFDFKDLDKLPQIVKGDYSFLPGLFFRQ